MSTEDLPRGDRHGITQKAHIGKRIRMARRNAGYESMDLFCHAIQERTGSVVSKRVLQRWESGDSEPGFLDVIDVVLTAEPMGGIEFMLPPMSPEQRAIWERAKHKTVLDL